jgi:hypothetical protein
MKRSFAVSIVLTGILVLLGGGVQSADWRGYEIIRLQDPVLEDYEITTPCYQFGTGIYGCRVEDNDDLWAVEYQWIRLSTDLEDLIPASEILQLDLYAKIDTSVKRIPAYYTRLISAGSIEGARKTALDRSYLDAPDALVDSVQAEVDKLGG